jgi:hypothetical protein
MVVGQRNLREELNKIGLGYIWQDPMENQMARICRKIRDACNGSE